MHDHVYVATYHAQQIHAQQIHTHKIIKHSQNSQTQLYSFTKQVEHNISTALEFTFFHFLRVAKVTSTDTKTPRVDPQEFAATSAELSGCRGSNSRGGFVTGKRGRFARLVEKT